MNHFGNSVDGTLSTANLQGLRFAQQPTNQQSGSISTSSGRRNVQEQNVQHQNTNPAVSQRSGILNFFRNPFRNNSVGSSASEPQAPALASPAPRVVPKSPLISAIENLLALSDDVFPKNEKDLVAHVQNCTDEQATAINETLAAAENVYLAEHCDEDKKGEFTQKKGAPSQAEFYKGKLQELLNKTIASEAQAVSSTDDAQPGNSNNTRKVSSGPTFFKEAIERHAKVIEEVDNFNTAINELSDELEKNNEDFDVERFLSGKNLSESDKNVIRDFVRSNSDQSLSVKVLRLKKNVNPNQEGVKHFIGSLFARPTTSIKIGMPSMPTKQDIKDAFDIRKGNFNLAKAIFKLDQVDFTGNLVSNFLNKHINDHSHSEAVRSLITAVTGIASVAFFILRAVKWGVVHTLGVVANAVTYLLPPLLALTAVVGLIALCIIKPEIGVPVLFGVILLGLIINQIFMRKEMKEQKVVIGELKEDNKQLKEDNKQLKEVNQETLEILKRLQDRLNVTPVSSVDSSRQGSRRVSLAESQDEVQLDADNADEVDLLAQQNAGDLEAPVVNGDANAQQNAEHPVGGQQDPDAAIPLGE
jgi:hypothetical protein